MTDADHTRHVLDLVAARRELQREKGYTSIHDDSHTESELPRAAINYLGVMLLCRQHKVEEPPENMGPLFGTQGQSAMPHFAWPFLREDWKHLTSSRDHLIEAIGYLVAEAERLDRLEVAGRVIQ